MHHASSAIELAKGQIHGHGPGGGTGGFHDTGQQGFIDL
jgi:hypothetical protein